MTVSSAEEPSSGDSGNARKTPNDLLCDEWRAYKAEAEEAFKANVTRSNDRVKEFAFAGIALLWVFRAIGRDGRPVLALDLQLAGALFCGGLALDLLQYMFGTAILSRVLDSISSEEKIDSLAGRAWPGAPRAAPPVLDQGGAEYFFWGKMICVLLGDAILLGHLFIAF